MSTDNKYIVFKVTVAVSGGTTEERELVVLFSHLLIHRKMIPATVAIARVVAAGSFRRLPDGRIEAYGKSTSIGKSSRGETDAALIANLLDGRT